MVLLLKVADGFYLENVETETLQNATFDCDYVVYKYMAISQFHNFTISPAQEQRGLRSREAELTLPLYLPSSDAQKEWLPNSSG